MNTRRDDARQEAAPTAEAAQAAIADEFAFFGDWTERYQYLIDLGRKLPPFPEALKTDAHKVTGCQSHCDESWTPSWWPAQGTSCWSCPTR